MKLKAKNGSKSSIVKGLEKVLADTYTLHLKTLNYHWNVTGPMFTTLHQTFEEQYKELGSAVDSLAERIRALSYRAPGSYAEFAKLTIISEALGRVSALEMIVDLLKSHLEIVDR